MHISARLSDPAVLEELGARLRRARLDRNVSQEELSEEAGIGRATLQRIEEGKPTSTVNLIRVLRALDLIEGLNPLVPELGPSPTELRQRRGRERQRARAPRTSGSPETPPAPWRWGDEGDPK